MLIECLTGTFWSTDRDKSFTPERMVSLPMTTPPNLCLQTFKHVVHTNLQNAEDLSCLSFLFFIDMQQLFCPLVFCTCYCISVTAWFELQKCMNNPTHHRTVKRHSAPTFQAHLITNSVVIFKYIQYHQRILQAFWGLFPASKTDLTRRETR